MHKDILNQMAFKPIIADHLKLIDTSIYKEKWDNLNNQFIKYESEAKGGILMNFDWIKTRSDFDDDKPAVIDHAKQTSWTYQQLNARADNMAHYLTSQGVKKGDVMGLFWPNDIAMLLDLLFACFKTGAVYH